MSITVRKLYKDTKALSPVVATILLVAIAVIASVLTYLWATGFIGGIQTTPQQSTEKVFVQSASYADTGTAYSIYVQNTGNQAVTYVRVFLQNSAGGLLAASAVLATAGPAGSIVNLTGAIAGAPAVAGQTVQLRVVTALGTSSTITITAGP